MKNASRFLTNTQVWQFLEDLNSDEALRLTLLRIVLRVLAVGWLVAFTGWITLILLKVPALAPGGELAMLRFKPYNPSYESMLTAVHLVWAVMLWRASYNPKAYPLFIDFTIWANVAHGLVMVVATPIQKGPVMMFVEALPLLGIAAALWWLRPERTSSESSKVEPSSNGLDARLERSQGPRLHD